MESSDLVRSPTLNRVNDPDSIRINRQLALIQNQLVAKFIDLDVEYGQRVPHHYRELVLLHDEIQKTLDQRVKEKDRGEALEEIMEVAAGRVEALFNRVRIDRIKLEEMIEEAADLVYRETLDPRFPRSIRLGLDVNRELVLHNQSEAKELLRAISNYRKNLIAMAFALDSVAETHRNLLVTHRTDNYEQDEIAWASYNAALEMIQNYMV